MSRTATLYRMVTPSHICPFGIKSKDLLQRRGFKVDDQLLRSREDVEGLKSRLEVETTPQAIIDGQRIGGYDALREYFGLGSAQPAGTTYRPVIAIFATCALLALALSWRLGQALVGAQTLQTFIALSMAVLAIQKLQDLYAFSNRFITYDLLAMRQVRYAYVYPFAELYVGLAMMAGLAALLWAPVALFIGGIGAVSVCKAVYVDKRELKCACVGGDADVPLGFVSLTENLVMVAAALWMWLWL